MKCGYFMFKDDMHWHTVDKFSREFKTKKNSAQPGQPGFWT